MAHRQQPIGSGFGPASTAADVAAGHDLTGRLAVVTGGYSGIGLETVRALAQAGAEVIVPARDEGRARAALAGIAGVTVERMELMDPAAIDTFAEAVVRLEQGVDVLILSAGIMAAPLARDARGYESQFSTNHLGHFQLTARLWPALLRARGARVVAVSSSAHTREPADFADPNFEGRPYDPWSAYSQSKSANVLFALELAARGQGAGVEAFSLHPGGIITNLGRHLPDGTMKGFGMVDDAGRPIIDPASGRKTPEQGAATSLWCALSPQLAGMGGVYCEDCDVAVLKPADAPSGRGVRPWAIDPAVARRLWDLSERLTGVAFAAA